MPTPARQPGPRVRVHATAEAAADAAAQEIARRARAAVTDHGSFTLAVSGGRSPGRMLAALAAQDMPWEVSTLFQVDERIGSADDPLRNLTGLRQALPAGCPVRVVPMPVEDADLDAACTHYAAALPRTLDLIHLGLGADGHTASLIPDDPVLGVADADVALTGVYQDRRRMTLTYPTIGRAGAILWLVTGADKRRALAQLRARDPSIPAGRVDNADQVLFCDAAAAGSDDGVRPGAHPAPVATLADVHRIFTTSVASVYPLYVTKVERKGRTRAELDEVIRWLTGFDDSELEAHLSAGTTFEGFFADARLNPNAGLITGSVCGVRVQDVEDPLMQRIRYLDKLVDELAKGRPMEKILRS